MNNDLNMDINKILKILKLISQIMLENGAETYRVEDTIMRICESFDFVEVEAIVIPTGAFISVSMDGASSTHTVIKRVKNRTIDLTKVNCANTISRQITTGAMTLEQAIIQLQDMSYSRAEKKLLPILAAGLSAGFFTLLFGGGMFDFSIAALSGSIVQIVAFILRREDMFHFIISLTGGIITASIAIATTHIFSLGNLELIISGGIMPLLPGLAMTNAIRDSMRGDLVSGVARGTEALIVAVTLAVGVMIVLKAWLLFGGGFSL